MVDSSGTAVVKYSYDAWGNILDVAGTLASTLGQDNPFRYKGYYYDKETGLYATATRYYDPEIGRFINADTEEIFFEDQDSLLQYNLFAYCFNNPTNMVDHTGESPANIIGGIIGGAVGVGLGYLLAQYLELSGWKKWALIAACGVGGAALGAFLGPYVAKLGSQIMAKLGIQAAKSIPKIGSQIGRLGKLAKNLKPIIKGTTEYSLKRMAQRGMTKALAQKIVNTGYAVAQSSGRTLFFTQAGAVVLNKAGEIVTTYTSKYFDAAMQEIIKQFYK